MQNLYRSRYGILIIIIVLYLVPILLLSSYGQLYMPQQKAWNLLAVGLFFSSFGTISFFWILCRLEQKYENQSEQMRKKEPLSEEISKSLLNTSAVDLSKNQAIEELQGNYAGIQEQLIHVKEKLEMKNEELQHFQHEYQILQSQLESTTSQQEEYKRLVQEELEKQKKLLADSQKTISDQRESMDKKLQQIVQLESKVSDLTYEIKTLIQLAEIENQTMPMYPSQTQEYSTQSFHSGMHDEDMTYLPEKQVRNEVQALMQLKRCIDIAQKITGANHYNSSNSRFKDLVVDNYTLDLRRLFESLRMENSSTIVFYSQKEGKILFVNNQSKNLLGWSPEKFMQSFNDIIEPSKELWRSGLASLALKNDANMSLKMKSKSGSQVSVQVVLGIIPTGIFRHHILGVLYTPS